MVCALRSPKHSSLQINLLACIVFALPQACIATPKADSSAGATQTPVLMCASPSRITPMGNHPDAFLPVAYREAQVSQQPRASQPPETPRLDISISNTILYQTSFGGSHHTNASGGDIDLVAKWLLLDDEHSNNAGKLIVKAEYRYQIGSRTPSRLNREIGSLTPTSDAFNERPPVVKELYWEHALADGRVVLSLGKIDPDSYYNTVDYLSPNKSFLNEAMSDNTAVRLPRRGLGINATVKPTSKWFFSLGVHDANGQPTTGDFRAIDELEFGYVAEVGVTPMIKAQGDGKYAVTFWYTDEREHADVESGIGIAFSAQQELSGDIGFFGRAGWADGDTSLAHRAFTGGLAFLEPFSREDDFFGIATGLIDPSRSELEPEYIIEGIYRFQLTQLQELSIGLQAILNPALAPDDDAVGVLSLRWRVEF